MRARTGRREQIASISEFFETRSQELFRLQEEFKRQQETLAQARGDLEAWSKEREATASALNEKSKKLSDTEFQLWTLEVRSLKHQREVAQERAYQESARSRDLELSLARA